MEKMYIQIGLFIDVLYSQNPFVKGVFLFIGALRRETDRNGRETDKNSKTTDRSYERSV